MKTYKGKISYLLPILSFPAIFTFGAILDGEIVSTPDFFFLMWLLFLVVVLIPLVYKLEIGNDFIKESFCGIKIKKFQFTNTESIGYGPVSLFEFIYSIFSIVHGKGLIILANIKGVRKAYSFSEKLYGKEAIKQVKTVLEVNTNN